MTNPTLLTYNIFDENGEFISTVEVSEDDENQLIATTQKHGHDLEFVAKPLPVEVPITGTKLA